MYSAILRLFFQGVANLRNRLHWDRKNTPRGWNRFLYYLYYIVWV